MNKRKKRSELIQITLTPEEDRAVREIARLLGTSVSKWVGLMALAAVDDIREEAKREEASEPDGEIEESDQEEGQNGGAEQARKAREADGERKARTA